MHLVSIPPPGTWLGHAALADILRSRSINTFLDVGCGSGHYSKMLCNMGLDGVGIDFGAEAITATNDLLAEEIHSGRYRTILADMACMPSLNRRFDLVISMMVVEHVEDDAELVRQLVDCIEMGGLLVVGVPGRKEKWSFEDEIVGHVRRYERNELAKLLNGVGVDDVVVWSVGVPTVNILAGIGDRLVKKHADEAVPPTGAREQTEQSGLQQIPFKTAFPKWFRLVLNRRVLWPLFFLQRRFYHSRFGIVLFGFGTVGSGSRDNGLTSGQDDQSPHTMS